MSRILGPQHRTAAVREADDADMRAVNVRERPQIRERAVGIERAHARRHRMRAADAVDVARAETINHERNVVVLRKPISPAVIIGIEPGTRMQDHDTPARARSGTPAVRRASR